MKKRNSIIIGFIIWAISNISIILLTEPIQNLAHRISDNPIFIKYTIPIVLGLIPFLIFLVFILNIIKEKPNIKDKNIIDILEPSKKIKSISISQLNELGIINVTSGLQSSDYAPKECMKRIKKQLLFVGILGSKWVYEEIFIDFLNRIESIHGEIKFLLINPNSNAYQKLFTLRDGQINPKSLEEFYKLSQKYECLKIKLYNNFPNFRMIFMDSNILAVSRYKYHNKGHIESKFGWENPHLIIEAHEHKWSLYPAYENLFFDTWENSIKLETYINLKEQNNNE